MPRKAKRRKVSKGIYQNGPNGTYTVRVTVGGVPYEDTLPADSTPEERKQKRADLESEGRRATPRAERGTLRSDVVRYIASIKHLATWDDRQKHLDAWCVRFGDVQRHRITERHVLEQRERWRTGLDLPASKRLGKAAATKPLSPKTIDHYCDTLRALYRRLDGRTAPTPCDHVTHLHKGKTIITRVTDETILEVDRRLQDRELHNKLCRFKGSQTRARFRVFVSTGKRPCEIMRALRSDVDLEARVWVPRDAKGGFCPGVYLNDDMLEAWKLFIEADAFGPYNHGSFARVIRNAGWPQDVRPYQARHSMWIEAVERGVPLEDVATGAGHKDMRLTQRVYTGIRNSRLQRMSETMNGRFQGWPVVPKRGSTATADTERDST